MIWKILSWESISFGGKKKNQKAKWIKADILKTQNELKVLSPSPALLRRHGKEGLAQRSPGLGESQLQTRFTFLAKLSLATHKEGAAFKKNIITRQPSTVEIKEKIQQHPQPPITQQDNVCCSFLLLWTGGAKLNWRRSVEQSGQHRQSLIIVDVWSGSSSHCAIAWWYQWAGYYYTICSSEDHSPAAAHSEWTKASPWERR